MNRASTKPLPATEASINAAADQIRTNEALQRLTASGDFELGEVDARDNGSISYTHTMRAAAQVRAELGVILGRELHVAVEPAFPCRASKAEMLSRTQFLATYAPNVGWITRVATQLEKLDDAEVSGNLNFDEAQLQVAHAETDIASGGRGRSGIFSIGMPVVGGTVTGFVEIEGFTYVVAANADNGNEENVSPYLVQKAS